MKVFWRLVFPFLLFGSLMLYMVGANFTAKLGLIDDHEIALFLGSDGKITFQEIPSVLMSTEIAKWGTSLRYRPSYYILRVLETAAWRDAAHLWYAARFVLFTIALLLMYAIAIRYLPVWTAYPLVMYLCTLPFWPDLLTRLGPAEIYAVPAFFLFVYGLIKQKMWMVALGYSVAIGVKENFLVLFPFLTLYAYRLVRIRRIQKSEIVTLALLFLYTFFIVAGVLLATSSAGTDIYGAEISYRYRVTKFVLDIPQIVRDRHVFPLLLISIVPISIAARYLYKKGWKAAIRTKAFAVIATMIAIVCVMASQYIFYINQLPSNMRYDFPALLLLPVLYIAVCLLIIELTRKRRFGRIVAFSLYLAISCVSTAYIMRRGYSLVRNQARINATLTQSFDQQLGRILAAQLTPSTRLVFVSQSTADFEPLVSLSRYLTAKQIPNPFMIHFTPDPKVDNPLARMLQDRILAASKGITDPEHLFDRFSQYTETRDTCYSITFGHASALPACPEIAHF